MENSTQSNSSSLYISTSYAPGIKSKYPMIEISSAKEIIQSLCKSLPSENIPVEESYGRVLSQSIRSPISFPPFRASIMVI
jgi:molybdopterin biosynthesis enzyme